MLLPLKARGVTFLGAGVAGVVRQAMWGLRAEPGSSARAVSALNRKVLAA